MLLDKESGILLQTVDSTNTYCKKKEIPNGYWVVSEKQTAGRGRHNREWISQGEENLFFSGKFILSNTVSSISLVSLLVGSAVLKSIIDIFPIHITKIKLKWPNDIYLGNKKVAGILIESEYIDQKSYFIAGIGINISGKAGLSTSDYLSETTLGEQCKTEIINSIIKYINEIEFILNNPDSIQRELDWIEQNSYLKNKKIETSQEGKKIIGHVAGYDRNGFLILKKEDEVLVSILDTGPDFKVI